jgi:UDP-3-O-[3-hydroxymyristoyl] N-acetylglucosamine deacetylase
VGLHTGEHGSVRIVPAGWGDGIRFRRIGSSKEIAAVAANIDGTTRCTALKVDGAVLLTVEHLLSAISGTGITDATVEFDAVEVPILDGSAQGFVAAIEEAGLASGDDTVEPIRLSAPIVLTGPGGGIVTAVPSDHLWATVVLDYSDKPSMLPIAATFNGSNYVSDIASARTYGFVAELEYLAKMGLAKGASRENAFALNDDGSADPTTPLRYPNEAARHKVLDLIGDLVLAGRPVCAGIVALRPSHTLNTMLAAELTKLAAGNQGE